MSQREDLPFAKVLTELVDGEKPFPPSHLFQLSGIDEDDARALSKVWEDVPVDRRRNLLRDMAEFAEDDALLFFDRVAIIALHDSDPQVRTFAVRLMGMEEEPHYTDLLLRTLESDPHYDVRAAAATALGQFVYLGEIEEIPAALHRRIEEALLHAYRQDSQVIVRRRALEAVSFSSREEINDLIEDAAHDPDEDWQASALFAMGASADQRWEQDVLANLDADLSDLRYEAVRAAGRLGLTTAKPVLFALAEEDDDENVRAAAVWALSDIGGSDVVEFIGNLIAETESDSEVEYLEEALENLMEAEMLGDLELPLFDFDDEDLLDDDDDQVG